MRVLYKTVNENNSWYYLDAPVNVGWGKKETQFHGTLGKEAAKIKSQVCPSLRIE